MHCKKYGFNKIYLNIKNTYKNREHKLKGCYKRISQIQVHHSV